MRLYQIKTAPGYMTIDLPLDAEGYFVDEGLSGPEHEKLEDHLRQTAAMTAHYAEVGNNLGDPHTADPNGIYDCGPVPEYDHEGCNKYRPKGKGQCTGVQEGKDGISATHGSCELYEEPNHGDFELDLKQHKLTKEEAGYGERPGKDPAKWGCWHCQKFGRKAKGGPDSKGRRIFCRFWGMRVQDKACCEKNTSPGDIAFEGNEPVPVDRQDSYDRPRVIGIAAIIHRRPSDA